MYTKTQIRDMLSLPLSEVVRAADRIRRSHAGDKIHLCGIVNAKSGACSEDCGFCAQSAHHKTHVKTYLLMSKDKIIESARAAKASGAEHFGIVTSGNKLTREEIGVIAQAVYAIKNEVGITPCASLGALDDGAFKTLKGSGLARYHHNIETSENYYKKIVSTHSYSERIDTVKLAKENGFEVCSGGIVGLGESWEDRIDMAFTLRDLDVDSVPLNFLVPIKGTPLENMPVMDAAEAVKVVALFRIVLGGKTLKVMAGRETVFKDFASSAYTAGANGMLVGGYLTVGGNSLEEDMDLVERVEKLWKENW